MKRSVAFLAILLPVAAFAQTATLLQTTPEDGPWQNILTGLRPRELGPVNMGGRIMDLAVYEKDPRIFFVGSASGGLFKTDNGGVTFKPIWDHETSVSLGAATVSQS